MALYYDNYCKGPDRYFKCLTCKEVFDYVRDDKKDTSEEALNKCLYHIKKYHLEKCFKCKFCDLYSMSRILTKDHESDCIFNKNRIVSFVDNIDEDGRKRYVNRKITKEEYKKSLEEHQKILEDHKQKEIDQQKYDQYYNDYLKNSNRI
jgi:hypothetical protein